MGESFLTKIQNKSFTLVEIIVVLIVLGVLVTLGLPAYQNTIEDSKAKVCQANLEALGIALDIYGMEHDTMPGSISGIPWEYIQRGYAQVLKKRGSWKIGLAYFLINLDKSRLAYATNTPDEPPNYFIKNALAKKNFKLITCPADDSPSSEHGSYGINEDILDKPYGPIADNTLLIADCDSATFNNSADLRRVNRHAHFNFNLMHTEYAVNGVTKKSIIGNYVTVKDGIAPLPVEKTNNKRVYKFIHN